MFRLRSLGTIAAVLIAGITIEFALAGPAEAQASRKNPFDGAKSWAYQLKNLNARTQARIARSPFDLVVIDYAKGSATPQTPLTRAEVAAMQRKPLTLVAQEARVILEFYTLRFLILLAGWRGSHFETARCSTSRRENSGPARA